MTKEKRLPDVFQTVGLPKYTYVKPNYYGEVRTDIEQPGKHLLIEGPSGIGKTCVIFKVFEELEWVKDENYKYVTCREPTAIDVLMTFWQPQSRETKRSGRFLWLTIFIFCLCISANK